MILPDPAIPKGATVVIIGANGYMALEVCEKLLVAGYHVRGTVRDVSKHEDRLRAVFADKGPGKFSLVQVADFETANAFDEAFKDASGVVFVSVPTIFNLDPAKVVHPLVRGLLNSLEAAKRAGVTRYVLNSSSKAVDSADYSKPSRELDTNTFNQEAITDMRNGVDDGSFGRIVTVYSAARALAEIAFWDWIKDNDAPFIANCVVPDGQFGRVLDEYSVEHGISSNGQLKSALEGDWPKLGLQLGKVKPLRHHAGTICSLHQAFISDVQDSARLMVAALISRPISNERIFSYHENRSWNDMRQSVRRLFPDRPDLVKGEDQALEGRDLATAEAPITRAENILKEVGQAGFATEDAILRDFVADMFP